MTQAADLTQLPPEVLAEARRQARLELARRSTVGAVRWRNPKLVPLRWQLELGAQCDRLVESALEGTGLRAIYSAPPRHGKTEFVGRGMPLHAYMRAVELGRPFAIFYVTSTDDRAREVSGRVRKAIERLYRETKNEAYAPGRIWTTTEWETRGGLGWAASGWSSATGGIGCNLLIMDDMIGTSQVYRSPAKRLSIRRCVEEDLMSRLEDGGAALQLETRRGTEDTTAWLTTEWPGTWEEHVWKCYDEARIPQGEQPRQPTQDGDNREEPAGDPRGYLWPQRYGEAWRRTMPHLTDSSPIWRSLYQQEPVAEGGTILEPEWCTHEYFEPPVSCRALADYVVISADLTNTKKKTSDPAGFGVWAFRGAYRDVLYAHQSQMGYVEQKRMLRDLAAEWRPNAIRIERAAGGDQAVEELQGELAGVVGVFPHGDKVTRLLPHLGRFAAGQVRLPAGAHPWKRLWREQHQGFTGVDGEDDHLVDCTSLALSTEVAQADPRAARQALRAVFGR